MTFAAARVAQGVTVRRAARTGIALPVLETSTHINQLGSVTSQLIAKPTGTVEGDWLFMVATLKNAGALTPPSDTVPWTLIEQAVTDNGHVRVGCWQKFAGASEPADYTWTWAGGARCGFFMGRYSGVDPADPINVRSFRKRDGADGGDSDKSIKLIGVTTDITNCLLLQLIGTSTFFTWGSPPYLVPPTPNPTEHVNDIILNGTSGCAHLIASEPLVNAGGTGNKQWDGNRSNAGFNGRITQLIAIAPIEGAPSKLELETTTDNLLLEDGSGVLLLE